jgi:hypothetical protein
VTSRNEVLPSCARFASPAVTDRHHADRIHGLGFMPAVIPAANDVMMELVGLVRIQFVAA